MVQSPSLRYVIVTADTIEPLKFHTNEHLYTGPPEPNSKCTLQKSGILHQTHQWPCFICDVPAQIKHTIAIIEYR